MLDAGADDDVVDAGGDQRRGEVDRLLGGAALAVDRRRRGLDRQAGLEPGVAADVEPLLAELLGAAGDHVAGLGRVDPGALEQLAVGLGQEVGGMKILVVALLRVAAADRGPRRLDDDYLAPAEVAFAVLHHKPSVRFKFVVATCPPVPRAVHRLVSQPVFLGTLHHPTGA